MFLFEKTGQSAISKNLETDLKGVANNVNLPKDYLNSAVNLFFTAACKLFDDPNLFDYSSDPDAKTAVDEFKNNKNKDKLSAIVYSDKNSKNTTFNNELKQLRSDFLGYVVSDFNNFIKNAQGKKDERQIINEFLKLGDYLGIKTPNSSKTFDDDSKSALNNEYEEIIDPPSQSGLSPEEKLKRELTAIAKNCQCNFTGDKNANPANKEDGAFKKFREKVSQYTQTYTLTADDIEELKDDFIEHLVDSLKISRYDKEAKKRQKIASAVNKDPNIKNVGFEKWANSLSPDQDLEKMFYSEVVKLQKDDDIESKIKKAANRKSAELMVRNHFKEIIGKQGYNYKDKNGYEHDIPRNTMASKISDEELEHWLKDPKNKQNLDKFQMYMGTVDSVFPGKKPQKDSEKTFSVAGELGGLMQLGAALIAGGEGIDMVNNVKDFAVNSQIGKFVSKQKELADELKDDPEAYREEQNKILNHNYEKSIDKVFKAETRKIKELKNNVWKVVKDSVSDKDKTKKDLDKLFEDIDDCVSEIRELQKDLATESDLNIINSIESDLNAKKDDLNSLKDQLKKFCETNANSEKARKVLEIFERIETAVDAEIKKISSVRTKGINILDAQIKNGKRSFKTNIKDYWDELNKSKVVKAVSNTAKKGYDHVKKTPKAEKVNTKI